MKKKNILFLIVLNLLFFQLKTFSQKQTVEFVYLDLLNNKFSINKEIDTLYQFPNKTIIVKMLDTFGAVEVFIKNDSISILKIYYKKNPKIYKREDHLVDENGDPWIDSYYCYKPIIDSSCVYEFSKNQFTDRKSVV